MSPKAIPAIALLVVVIDALLLSTGVIGPGVAFALFLAVEVPLGATVVISYVRRYRAHRTEADGVGGGGAGSVSRREAVQALAADDAYLRLIAAEARTLASLGRWIARKPDVPAGAVAIGYSRGTLGMPIAMAIAALIELVALHLLVPWPTVRLVLDLLGVYALIVVLGWLAGRIVRPHLITGGELVLRSGPAVCARIPLDAVVRVFRDRRLSPTDAGIEATGDQGVLALPGPDGTCLSIELDRPVRGSVPTFPWSRPPPEDVTVVRLHVDDPEAAGRALTAAASTAAGAATDSAAAREV